MKNSFSYLVRLDMKNSWKKSNLYFFSCHINANWPGKITWHMAMLIRIKLLVHTGWTEAGFTLWYRKLNDPLLPSLSPQINMNRFLLNGINFTCPLSHIWSLMASATGCLSHILFSRPARVFYNTYFQPALGSKMTQIKMLNCLSSSQHLWMAPAVALTICAKAS